MIQKLKMFIKGRQMLLENPMNSFTPIDSGIRITKMIIMSKGTVVENEVGSMKSWRLEM